MSSEETPTPGTEETTASPPSEQTAPPAESAAAGGQDITEMVKRLTEWGARVGVRVFLGGDASDAPAPEDAASAQWGILERLVLWGLAEAAKAILDAFNLPGATPAFQDQIRRIWGAVASRIPQEDEAPQADDAPQEDEAPQADDASPKARLAFARAAKAGRALRDAFALPGATTPALRAEIRRLWGRVGDHLEGRCGCGSQPLNFDGGQTPAPSEESAAASPGGGQTVGFMLIGTRMFRLETSEGDAAEAKQDLVALAPIIVGSEKWSFHLQQVLAQGWLVLREQLATRPAGADVAVIIEGQPPRFAPRAELLEDARFARFHSVRTDGIPADHIRVVVRALDGETAAGRIPLGSVRASEPREPV